MVDEAESHASELLGVVRGPEPHLFDGRAFFFEPGQQLSKRLGQEEKLERLKLLLHELADHAQGRFHALGDREVHLTRLSVAVYLAAGRCWYSRCPPAWKSTWILARVTAAKVDRPTAVRGGEELDVERLSDFLGGVPELGAVFEKYHNWQSRRYN